MLHSRIAVVVYSDVSFQPMTDIDQAMTAQERMSLCGILHPVCSNIRVGQLGRSWPEPPSSERPLTEPLPTQPPSISGTDQGADARSAIPSLDVDFDP